MPNSTSKPAAQHSSQDANNAPIRKRVKTSPIIPPHEQPCNHHANEGLPLISADPNHRVCDGFSVVEITLEEAPGINKPQNMIAVLLPVLKGEVTSVWHQCSDDVLQLFDSLPSTIQVWKTALMTFECPLKTALMPENNAPSYSNARTIASHLINLLGTPADDEDIRDRCQLVKLGLKALNYLGQKAGLPCDNPELLVCSLEYVAGHKKFPVHYAAGPNESETFWKEGGKKTLYLIDSGETVVAKW